MQAKGEILGNITSIRTGYTFREKIAGTDSGDILVLQPKDLINKQAIAENAINIDSSQINSIHTHLLKNGDILIANKGLKFSTLLYDGHPNKCVASSSFFVITADNGKILPDYLVWYLEQPPVKSHLFIKATGSVIPSINKSAVQQIPILLPSLETQEYINQLLKVTSEELEKLQQLRERKSEFYDRHIWEKIMQEA
jgi:restriction endonuclease S subunit